MSEFAFRLDEELSDRERAEVERLLPQAARLIVHLRRARVNTNLEKLVDMFVGDVEITPVDMQLPRLQAAAKRAVLEGSEWLTAPQIGELAKLGTANPVGTVSRWKAQKRIFSIRRSDREYYPRYGLGEDFHPLPALKEAIRLLEGWSGERLAAWFESRSGFLGGQRPREILATEPAKVLSAARDSINADSIG